MRGDENSPHLVVKTHEGNAHVLPVALIEDLIEGSRKIADVDDGDAIMRAIFDEWMCFVKEDEP